MIFYYFKLENTCSKKSERCDKPLLEWHKGAAVRLRPSPVGKQRSTTAEHG